jgi:hypothetical protein
MLTKSDIQKIKKGLATKKDLQEFSKKAFQTFATKEEIRELKKEISSLKEMVQTSLLQLIN